MQESRLTVALDERFDDIDEVRDVANHGCGGGVSGFIYYHETRKFFNEYEEEIEEELQEIFGDRWMSDMVASQTVWDTMTFKNHCVWVIVELYCQNKRDEDEDTTNYEWKGEKLISNLST